MNEERYVRYVGSLALSNNGFKERLDILLPNGEELIDPRSGNVFTATRDDAHKYGLFHNVVIFALVDSENGEILCQQRGKTKKYAGYWDISGGGHVTSGGDPMSATAAEVREELDLPLYLASIPVRNMRVLGNSYHIHTVPVEGMIENQYYTVVACRAIDASKRKIKFQRSEVKQIKWFSLPALQRLREAKNVKFMPARETAIRRLIRYAER